jgi:hypothetical protein
LHCQFHLPRLVHSCARSINVNRQVDHPGGAGPAALVPLSVKPYKGFYDL